MKQKAQLNLICFLIVIMFFFSKTKSLGSNIFLYSGNNEEHSIKDDIALEMHKIEKIDSEFHEIPNINKNQRIKETSTEKNDVLKKPTSIIKDEANLSKSNSAKMPININEKKDNNRKHTNNVDLNISSVNNLEKKSEINKSKVAKDDEERNERTKNNDSKKIELAKIKSENINVDVNVNIIKNTSSLKNDKEEKIEKIKSSSNLNISDIINNENKDSKNKNLQIIESKGVQSNNNIISEKKEIKMDIKNLSEKNEDLLIIQPTKLIKEKKLVEILNNIVDKEKPEVNSKAKIQTLASNEKITKINYEENLKTNEANLVVDKTKNKKQLELKNKNELQPIKISNDELSLGKVHVEKIVETNSVPNSKKILEISDEARIEFESESGSNENFIDSFKTKEKTVEINRKKSSIKSNDDQSKLKEFQYEPVVYVKELSPVSYVNLRFHKSPILEKLVTEGYETPKMMKTLHRNINTNIKLEKRKRIEFY